MDKLRKKAGARQPRARDAEAAPASSALPPGSSAPPLRARVHGFVREHPEALEALSSAADFEYAPMSPADAEDLADLQAEWFPPESYPGGAPWCAELLADPGVVALKASLPSDPSGAAAGIYVALGSKAAIEHFTEKSTVQTLRQELTVPRFIPWDAPERRELAYVLSVGVIGELRRRGVAAELLRRGLAGLQDQAPDLRAVALDLAAYNKAAIRCYEAAGFKRLAEQPEAYAGVGRRTHSSLLYALLPGEAEGPGGRGTVAGAPRV